MHDLGLVSHRVGKRIQEGLHQHPISECRSVAPGWTVVDMKMDWNVIYPFER
jgi:hypothetical protein